MKKEEYVIDPDAVELERLKEQGRLVTKALPELSQLKLEKGQRVLDIACGAGEWAVNVAWMNPDVEVIGIDINASAIAYANDQSKLRGCTNIEFRVMDIYKPLEFEDESCDYINMRFVVGVLPGDYWSTLLTEIKRILVPGGKLRLIESEYSSVAGAPNWHFLQMAAFKAFWTLGKSFAPDQIALGPMIKKFVKEADFTNLELSSHIIDFSSDSPWHETVREDFIEAAQLMQKKGLFTSYGGLTQEEYDTAFVGMCQEMRSQLDAWWYIFTVLSQK
ncbi:MAG TPA: class I SAM-dependent methyltransferase [Dictyobacter sp.]|nr:class I SAM-dependent methyltransferase [Dictyobacter sp.]